MFFSQSALFRHYCIRPDKFFILEFHERWRERLAFSRGMNFKFAVRSVAGCHFPGRSFYFFPKLCSYAIVLCYFQVLFGFILFSCSANQSKSFAFRAQEFLKETAIANAQTIE